MRATNDTPQDEGAPLPDVGAWFGVAFTIMVLFAMYIARYTA